MFAVITQHLSSSYDAALALVYPQACAVCGRSVESRHDGSACAACWSSTHVFREDDPQCWKCGALAGVSVAQHQHRNIRCGRCDDDGFTFARAVGLYEGALRASILQLKREPHLTRRLAQLILELQEREPLRKADLIVPVPLHPERERERGFNQALILARELSHLSGRPLEEHSLARRVHTERHRAGMDSIARRQSVASAFAVRHPKLVAGQRVLLVDDVFTTGSTVSACAVALKAAGVAEVFVLTIARA